MSCSTGWDDCSASENTVRDGCETNVSGDAANCGGCGDACSTVHGTPSCTGSQCSMSCGSGWADCSADEDAARDGCETNVATDAYNCGACDNDCTDDFAQATGYCSSSTCQMGACVAGWGDCNVSPSDGCETNTATGSTIHCGACNYPCTNDHGTSLCGATVSGQCSVDSCSSGWADCSADENLARNGCETNLASIYSCGSCTNTCDTTRAGASVTCSGGCVYSCNSGYADCDSDLQDASSNGCETNLSNDVDNCGACDYSCNGRPHSTATGCSLSACELTCDSGWGNCNGQSSDGCEVDLSSDPNNCGLCGLVCGVHAPGAYCIGGLCSSGLTVDCDGAGEVATYGQSGNHTAVNFQHNLRYVDNSSRIVIVGVSFRSGSSIQPTGCIYGSQQLTYISTEAYNSNVKLALFYLLESALPNTTGNKNVQIQWTSDQTYESQTIVMACEGVQQTLPPNKFGLYAGGLEPYDEFTAAENDVDDSWIYSQIAWDQGSNWHPGGGREQELPVRRHQLLRLVDQ